MIKVKRTPASWPPRARRSALVSSDSRDRMLPAFVVVVIADVLPPEVLELAVLTPDNDDDSTDGAAAAAAVVAAVAVFGDKLNDLFTNIDTQDPSAPAAG